MAAVAADKPTNKQLAETFFEINAHGDDHACRYEDCKKKNKKVAQVLKNACKMFLIEPEPAAPAAAAAADGRVDFQAALKKTQDGCREERLQLHIGLVVITAALRTCLYGSERMDRFVKKVKLTSDAPSTTAVCNSPSDATLQSSARQVADYERSPLVIVLDSDCEVNEEAICIQSSAMPTIQSRADFEPGVSFSQSHTASTALAVATTEVDRDINQFDIGLYVNRTNFPDHRRYELLTSCWIPPENYEFKEDASGSRSFRQLWLKDYSPWLAYSRHLKGAFCKFCVLFPQKVSRGFQGGFIATPFTRYKDFHSYAKEHMKSSWHQGSHGDATNFLSICERKQLSVVQKLSDVHLKTIEDNRKKLYPIVYPQSCFAGPMIFLYVDILVLVGTFKIY
eukprot:Em0002g907a